LAVECADDLPGTQVVTKYLFSVLVFLFQQVQVRKNLPADFQKLTSVGEQETRGDQSEPMPRGIKAKILSSSAEKKH